MPWWAVVTRSPYSQMHEETFEHIVERGTMLVALVVVVTPGARGRCSVTDASLLSPAVHCH